MTVLKWTAIIALTVYAGLVMVLYVTQRSLMYFPERTHTLPETVGLPNTEDVMLETGDGENVFIWHTPPQGDRPVVLYLHGNGGALRHRAERFRVLTQQGIGLVALDYRGYGGSTGRPFEAGLITDALAAYVFATRHYPIQRIAIWGESLGTAVAVALASEKPANRLILEAPFTSAVEMAARLYPFIPVKWLMKDQFRSEEKIGSIGAPLLILHGARDMVAPIELGERLFAAANHPKKFVRFPDGGHEDLDRFGAMEVVEKFIGNAFE
jgi:fermentation-respiration switch protein FrsA (DUF1100 family)